MTRNHEDCLSIGGCGPTCAYAHLFGRGAAPARSKAYTTMYPGDRAHYVVGDGTRTRHESAGAARLERDRRNLAQVA